MGWSLPQFRHDPFQKFPSIHDRCLSPLFREVALVARNEEVCSGRFSALQESVVSRIVCDVKHAPGSNMAGCIRKETKRLPDMR